MVGTTSEAPVKQAEPVGVAADGQRPRPWLAALALVIVALLAWWLARDAAPPAGHGDRSAAATLWLVNEDGTLRITGRVDSAATRDRLLSALQATFGADRVTGEIAIDPAAGPGLWVDRLPALLPSLTVPGVEARFTGKTVAIGGLLLPEERRQIRASAEAAYPSGFMFAALPDRDAELLRTATEKALSALAGLPNNYTAPELVAALNLAVIRFETGQHTLEPASEEMLVRAAEAIRAAPAGTRLEIGGHTDNVGDEAANLVLSRQRAEAVLDVLVKNGVDPAMLTAKGYGDRRPIARNDTKLGRYQNRRIEFTVVELPSAPPADAGGSQ